MRADEDDGDTMARPPASYRVELILDPAERDFFLYLQDAVGALGTDGPENLVRIALYHLAEHIDVPVATGTFALREGVAAEAVEETADPDLDAESTVDVFSGKLTRPRTRAARKQVQKLARRRQSDRA